MTEAIHRKTFNRYPMLWLAVCFAAGILLARFAVIGYGISTIGFVAASILALAFRRGRMAAIFVGVGSIAVGTFSYQAELASVRPDRLKVLYDSGIIDSGSPVEIEGVLTSHPERSVEGKFLTVRDEKLRYRGSDLAVSGNVRIFVPEINPAAPEDSSVSEISNLKYGSRVRVACDIEREDEYLDPGVIPKREALDRLDIDATGTVKSELLIEHLADESVFLPLAWVYDERANLIDEFRRNLSPRAAGVMIASVLGDRHFLDKETADLFRDGGTFHILVISGLHITFIGGILLLIVRRLTRDRWLQFGATSAALWCYALAVGANVPVVRASIMFTIILFGYAIYRQAMLLNSLGLCALVLLAWRPSDIVNPSFQLSFISVAAIIGIAYPIIDRLRKIGSWSPTPFEPFPPNVPAWLRRLCETFYWNGNAWAIESKRQIWTARLLKSPFLKGRIEGFVQRIVRYILEGLLVSLIVQFSMLPVMVVYFHRVSLVSIFLNLWVAFFVAVESFAVFAGIATGHLSSLLAAGFFGIADAVNWVMLILPHLFADNGWASLRLPAYIEAGRLVYLLYFLSILVIAIAVNKWTPFSLSSQFTVRIRRGFYGLALATSALFGVIVLHPFSVAPPDGRLHVDFLDVGQGDSALLTFPDGETLLVDGGGRPTYRQRDEEAEPFETDTQGIGEAVVSEVLWAKGYSAIDHILATHADADHIQGLTDVAKNFGIGSAIFGRTPLADADFAALAAVLERRGIPSEVISRGEVLRFGNASVEVLYPLTGDTKAVSDNNHSVVLRVVYGSRAFLLTGDIERQAESELLNNGGTLAADVIKVPHHGSRTSSTQGFIDAVHANYAVISVGRHSPFGHPHPEVVERLLGSGATVMTTGERGMVSVSTDGKDLIVRAFNDNE